MASAPPASKHLDLSLNDALYNHLVLPPQLPHREDPNLIEIESALIERVLTSARYMRDTPEHPSRPTWEALGRSIQATKSIHFGGRVDRSVLARELSILGENDFLLVYVQCQNCALYIRRSNDPIQGPSVIFEAFEAAARNEDILAAENALQWDFPGCAAAVPMKIFLDEGFIDGLASFIENASRESIKDFSAHTFKAGATIVEYRNTPEPALVSSMLMGFLQSNGRRFAPTLLQKKVRDDVCWKNAKNPWRRLPYWLVLRVAISRYLSQQLGGEVGRAEFKFFMVHLLSDFLLHIQTADTKVERLDLLKKKICRRLVKLEVDKDRAQSPIAATRIELLFTRLNPGLQQVIKNATDFIDTVWRLQKLKMEKKIPSLPRRASPADLRLDLHVSGEHLQSILKGDSKPKKRDISSVNNVSVKDAAKKHLSAFAQFHAELVYAEQACKQFCLEPSPSKPREQRKAIGDAAQILYDYMKKSQKLYKDIPQLMSTSILNIMDLWVKIDQSACALYPLLLEYHPVFHPGMLDVLLCSTFEDMERVHRLQLYLQGRVSACERNAPDIFGDPVRGCFGQRYYEKSPESAELRDIHEDIESQAERWRVAKEKEWKAKTAEYAALSKSIEDCACVYIVDEDNPLGRGIHSRNCNRCHMMRQLKRMNIQAYEHPLPSDGVVAKAVIFELACPAPFAIYRDVTWRVVSSLAIPFFKDDSMPRCFIRDYGQLGVFVNEIKMSCSLASKTKPFLTTHYSSLCFPVEWESSNGKDGDSAFSDLVNGPSSYEISSTASKCPTVISAHEYLAFQTIASGKSRRWPSILTELGSANLNFSNEATMLLLAHLTAQCGPRKDGEDPFRLVHAAFRDSSFCHKLIEQLSHRLDSLSANWRETYLMETVISLALRLVDLAMAADKMGIFDSALDLLVRARYICVRWFKLLRAETYKVTDSETAQRFQQYTLWAGLLCKQTFTLHVTRGMPFDDISMEAYIQGSVMVQDSLVVELKSLPTTLHYAVVRDMRLSYSLCRIITNAILAKPEVFGSSLKEMWPEEENCARKFSNISLEELGWISCHARASEEENVQFVLYNCMEGVLLVDGFPMGKLPKDRRQCVTLNELFGNQALLTYPSDRRGMQYALCVKPFGYQVHVGFSDNGQVVVRAFQFPYSLQLIPRETFRDGNNWDLPGQMLDGCFHWLNLNNGEVLITKRQNPWPARDFRGYKINMNNRTCTRMRYYNNQVVHDSLVNPYSPLFCRATRILDSLEHRQHIFVMQPGGGRHLQVELPRLQILFHVNSKLALQSPQLQCEIDSDQDPGTWYGLQTKLVVRSISNPMHRSILVPLGKIAFAKSDGCHVAVRIDANGSYGRYPINDTLGRLNCAAEPVLVYTKALLHALTSFLIPDPLTGRTGTEEAIEWLQSGVTQPWNPLNRAPMEILEWISRLTPRREYYPLDLRVMKTDHWMDFLPATIQNSALRPLVEHILQVSKSLAAFSDHPVQAIELPSAGDDHLHKRALLRHQVLERYVGDAKSRPLPVVSIYHSRDRPSHTTIRHRNVLEITHWIRAWPQKMETTDNLVQILATQNLIGGYDLAFDKVCLSDRLKTDVVQNWGSLVKFAQNATTRYSLMLMLAPMAFRLDADLQLLRTLIAFSIFKELRYMETPIWEEYHHFQPDQVPQLDYILRLLKPFAAPPPQDDTSGLEQFASAKQQRKWQAELFKHEYKVEEDSKFFANFLLTQWPCIEPSIRGLDRSVLIDLPSALEAIRPEWKRLYMNMDLTKHLREVQKILDRRTSKVAYELPVVVLSDDSFPIRLRGKEVADLSQLMLNPVSPRPAVRSFNDTINRPFLSQSDFVIQGVSRLPWPGGGPPAKQLGYRRNMSKKYSSVPLPTPEDVNRSTLELEMISKPLENSRSAERRRYAGDLQKSLAAFRLINPSTDATNQAVYTRESSIEVISQRANECFSRIRSALDASSTNFSSRRIEWLKAGGMWPVITKGTVLGQLRSTASQELFGSGMRKELINLGVKVTELQREIRLHDLALKNASGQYYEENANKGHSNWNPDEYPDWLLLEIESNMMIRPVQIDVAKATISPESGSNSVLQMNMGQGKTSCIIPMVAAALADKTRLVRVIVPKALLQQTSQLLQSRLGGILGRQLRHVPFSRRTATANEKIKAYWEIHKDMMKSAGIMICQPDHIMSFMLSGCQRLVDDKLVDAGPMINIQNWLTRVSRDILDESDYTLAVRTQLIYPSGSQMTVDGHPDRWLVAEAVLRLVDGHVDNLCRSFPHSISIIRRITSGFPLIYFLRPDVEDELIRRVTADICQGLGGILPMSIHAMAQSDRVAIKDFISAARPRTSSVTRIQKLCPDRPNLRQTIYLLRGLLVSRILMTTLRKRWNVEYGLHPNRDPIAVPFHAKGVPSEQSEWGHPDVAILLTCLAFYYDGVSLAQLKQCLEHILKSDDPSAEYDKWTTSIRNYPSSLRAWNSINVDDDIQLNEIWRNARYTGVVIDYFLNNFVFPRHAKQFKVKLQSNAWDIPLVQVADEPSNSNKHAPKPLTTGFSGTNDNRTMLPLNIEQQDLPSLLHTSAEVLTYLLHPRNKKCVLPQQLRRDRFTGRASEFDLLHGLKERNIRVLIDAGAQILEMNNSTLAEEWLKIDSGALAAMYFDEANKPWVVTKQGKKTPLLASPFADDLGQCLVYLDEAHTRGTDLKIPPTARGALTLGLGQTKDHTVQAAMRLRQLGTTQSVTFFIPPEVHQGIADLQGKTIYDSVDSSDVIEWLLDNTCESIEQLQPLYYSQGVDYCRRMQAAFDNPKFLTMKPQREKYVATIKQDEQQTLQQLYDPKPKARNATQNQPTNGHLKGFMKDLNSRKKRFQDNGRAVHASALQQVEQEREVAFEVESVRQVKKPHHYAAHSFPGLNADLESFARTGRMPADAHYFSHVFSSLSKTGLGRKFRVSRNATDSKLFVTAEFDKTIKQKLDNVMDNFLRPVNWLLWSPITETAVVIIPEEADALIPMLRDPAVASKTYLLTYAAPITRKMLHFNELTYYSIPSLPHDWKAPKWLRVELGVFAGRLYFDWSEYKHMCDLLDIHEGVVENDDLDILMAMDGAGDEEVPEGDQQIPPALPVDGFKFASKPLTFMQEWLAVRRRGQDFAHSPMGFVSQGKTLRPEHPFFSQAEDEASGERDVVFAPVTHRPDASGPSNQDEDDYHGVDDMGANTAADMDACDDRIVYDESEYGSSGSRSAVESGNGSD
ncbi:hypothetical protein EDB81DRAFT_861125 [Dactylonectria macrodidyma]|uniref:ubiquitinyl hydrolase 1 n=1 Tax=Dactylonectria macrodidyma TaxID=307937 RepID=A0A9P9II35_9HYPO|nr:hypothetical protein EDB81DRAFT_861125 [Dactylonectria macrodidyma]